jgi:MOSC domain-containing protein YiiM
MQSINGVGKVVAVCRSATPGLPKPVVDEIHLLEAWGVEGDYHAGTKVRHRYLARKYPDMPNRRQVLLVDIHVFSTLEQEGISLLPGMMGENIAVSGLPLMTLPTGTRLKIGEAILEITEVRDPCKQLNGIDPRLLKAVMKKEQGKKVPQAGIMAQILQSGWVHAGDSILVLTSTTLPATQN